MEETIRKIKEVECTNTLNRIFPGNGCGNKQCEKLCRDALQIAKILNKNHKMLILDLIKKEIAPGDGCIEANLLLQKPYFTTPCRFGFVKPNNHLLKFGDGEKKVVGKKYISDSDASKTGACTKCLKNANKIFKWPDETDKMPKLPIHPNCKCHYENIYENISTEELRNKLKSSSKIPEKEISDSIESIEKSRTSLLEKNRITTDDDVFLVFDGRFLYSGNGEIVLDAVSGKPIKETTTQTRKGRVIEEIITKTTKVFDYSVDRQKEIGKGGIPEGIYHIKPSETRTITTSPRSHIGGNSSWGNCSWSLHKEEETETYDREGFFIHGGTSWGSAGCIDVKTGDKILDKYIKRHTKSKIYVKVQYRKTKETITEKKTSFNPEYITMPPRLY